MYDGQTLLLITISTQFTAIASDEGHSPTKDEKRAVPEVVPETIEDTPWIDEDTDTRVPHALAGQIKHINRSRWKFTNIDTYKVNCCNLHSLSEAPPKPWRPFPGEMSLPHSSTVSRIERV